MTNVRTAVLFVAAFVAVACYAYVRATIPVMDLQNIRLAELYGALSLVLLYAALLVSPLYRVFPGIPGRTVLQRARRAIGVSAFCLALLHTGISFWRLLAGWQGLSFLSGPYRLDLIRSFFALVVLALLTVTSSDYAVRKLGVAWKWLHRLLYPAALVVLWHTLALGSHFVRPDGPAPIVAFVLFSLLLLLESVRLDRWLAGVFPAAGNLGAAFATTVFGIAACGFLYFGGTTGLSIHSDHERISTKSESPR